MNYLDPRRYPVWKIHLRDGEISPDIAATVGAALGTIHAATAGNEDLAKRFATDSIFEAIRIEPLFAADRRGASGSCGPAETARKDDRRKPPRPGAWRHQPQEHSDRSRRSCIFSTRNAPGTAIRPSTSPSASIILLLKCVWRPQWKARYIDAFAALAAAYFGHPDWESANRLKPGPPPCFPACCWRVSMAPRPWNTSRRTPTETGCAGLLAALSWIRPKPWPNCAASSGNGYERFDHHRRSRAGGYGIPGAARRWRRKSRWQAGRRDAGSRPPERPAGITKRSICETAAPHLADMASRGRWRTSTANWRRFWRVWMRKIRKRWTA